MRARGGFEVDVAWTGGRPEEVVIRSSRGGPCAVRLGDKTVRFDTRPGGEYRLDGALDPR